MPLDGILAVLAAFAVTLLATPLVRARLQAAAILDTPNDRSSHTNPTPRGGGIAVMAAIVVAAGGWSLHQALPAAHVTLPVACALALGLVSWFDDLHTLNPGTRILAQAAVVGAYFVAVSAPVPPFLGGITGLTAGAALVFVAWLWWINLYNFMDGIDAIAGFETIAICLGVALVVWTTGKTPTLLVPALIVGAAAAGFLVWNRPPARIFLGDVGSVPLGFLTGWLLLELAAEGALVPAVILSGYYAADATITLARRALRREKVWQAHKEHFYQHAHQQGLSHGAVVGRILVGNAALIGLALAAAAGHTVPALIGAVAVVAVLLLELGRKRKRGT